MHLPNLNPITLLLIALFSSIAQAQFGFFDQMFGGGGGNQQAQQQQQRPQNGPSDSSLYQTNFERLHCDNYLCPDTLGKPHLPIPPKQSPKDRQSDLHKLYTYPQNPRKENEKGSDMSRRN
ncbi:hypothetical protein FHL15_009219 [Xylaria flabelliformis]|uniref:Long chronological lifespan protein 2 n=1 Tax=Xylaria flabelliformis TaxID=2512241 RepID=A0A553HPS3_9PEZI|nr:hypothetical protein FHL15_009219 [Xylaria flabelliformis]